VYAVRDEAAAARYLVGRNEPGDLHRVIGEVALWGWVVVADAGWRASHAYPARIVVPSRRPDGRRAPAEQLASALSSYGVPVDIA
jgi:hypothetical protein